MSVNDTRLHPWLEDEKALIREAVSAGLPFWGSCLGVQLLASALGATVILGRAPEVGVLAVYPTAEGRADPVLGPCRWPLRTLQWHGDTFELPEGGALLATSPAYHTRLLASGGLRTDAIPRRGERRAGRPMGSMPRTLTTPTASWGRAARSDCWRMCDARRPRCSIRRGHCSHAG